MKTIAFFNNKGGVGKTASLTNVAYIMAEKFNRRVLVIDIDPQGNAGSTFCDMDSLELFLDIMENRENRRSGYSIEDVLLDLNLDPRVAIRQSRHENLSVIPAHMTLEAAQTMMNADVTSPQQLRLKRQLIKLEEDYDFCLIDCRPAVGLLNVNALAATDSVYIPTRCDVYSLQGIAYTLRTIREVSAYNEELSLGGCFFTQYSGRKNVEKFVMDILKDVFGDKLLDVTIRSSKYIEEGTMTRMPLLLSDPNEKQKITQEYVALTEHILSKESQ